MLGWTILITTCLVLALYGTFRFYLVNQERRGKLTRPQSLAILTVSAIALLSIMLRAALTA